MRAKYASNPALSQAGKAKKCSHCGQVGHNRKTCPELTGEDAAASQQADPEIKEVLDKLEARDASRTCSVCGQVGHNRRSCPEAAKPAQEVPPKLIVIEEETDEETSSSDEAETVPGEQQGGDSNQSYAPAYSENLATGGGRTATQPEAGPKGQVSLSQMQSRPSGGVSRQVLRPLPGSDMSLSSDGTIVFPLPLRQEQCVTQAAGAVLRAWGDGIRRQSLELLLPQSNSVADVGWPGGIRQQFRAVLPMVEGLLLRLKRTSGLEGRITAELIDESDCVGAWQSEKLAAVVFPTADSLPAVQRIDDALSGERLVMMINPQWQPQGQIVSDFGFGRSRRAAERFVNSLEEVYYLRRVRVLGDEIRVLRCYPGRWQVHFTSSGTQEPQLLSLEDDKPTYERLLELLRGVRGSQASKPWLDRVLSTSSFDRRGSYSEGSGDRGVEVEAADVDAAELQGDVERDIVTGEVIEIES